MAMDATAYPAGGLRPLLRGTGFRRLALGQTVSGLGDWMATVALMVLVLDLSGSSAAVGAVLVLRLTPAILAGPLVARIVRHWDRRSTMLAMDAARAGIVLAIPLVDALWWVYLCSFFLELAGLVFLPARDAAVPDLAQHDSLPLANGVMLASSYGTIPLGALMFGVVSWLSGGGVPATVFVLDAATFVVYGAVMLALVPAPVLGGAAQAPGRGGSYREVLRHRPFVAVIGLNALFIFAGFSGFELLPVYAKNEAAVSETQIGLVFFVNTLVIVLLQLPIARLSQGRRRMPALGLLGLLWAAAWLIVPFAGATTAVAATLLLIGAMTIFAVGECLHGAVQAPLVSDLADPRLLGRYMALSALSWQIGFALGPAVGGFVLDYSPNATWLGAAAVCLVGGALAFLVETTLPARARRTPEPAPASA
jgi:MFS family permease